MPADLIFDAHLDLACLAVRGRDMTTSVERDAAPWPPASVSLPALAAGGVRFALATIFTEPVAADAATVGPEQYRSGDTEGAHRRGRAQLEVYLTWRDRGLLAIDLPACLRADASVGEFRGGMGAARPIPFPLEKRIARLGPSPPLHIGLLMEGADPVREPSELSWWHERGVGTIGLTWARSSRYAGGNAAPDGLTDAGRQLVREIDRLNMTHDVSHLSDRSFAELIERSEFPGGVVASHSNCRALLGDHANQRHLSDAQIRHVVARDGVIGLNLYSKFLVPASRPANGDDGEPVRATIAECLAHVDHICSLAGDTRHVGLGSDMDGGFGADQLPDVIDGPGDLARLSEGLSERGWSDGDVANFAWRNWARFYARES
ncbi:MAG: membrane dipeptidase [Phycisphaerae bacterium]|nr:membrane dipeptidase [Phycisphaerae bacterium]